MAKLCKEPTFVIGTTHGETMKKFRMNLFVIEDDDIDYMAVERAIQKSHCEVVITRARDGQEALMYLEEGAIPKPTLFLVDLQMPRLNGIEFLYHLRRSQKYHDSVVVVMSTSTDPGDINDCYRSQIAAYFEKSTLNASFEPLIQMIGVYQKHVRLPSDYL